MGVHEINLKGSFRYGSGDYETAISLVSSGRVQVESLISHMVSTGMERQGLDRESCSADDL